MSRHLHDNRKGRSLGAARKLIHRGMQLCGACNAIGGQDVGGRTVKQECNGGGGGNLGHGQSQVLARLRCEDSN